MEYQIMQHVGGRKFVPAMRDDKPLIYSCPKKAAEVAAIMTEGDGLKYQPRPIKGLADLFDWRVREQLRFKKGEYQPVIWADEPWWKDIPDHFAHVGVKDKTRIAFTPDAEKGEADRQTAMLPGKYLQQFFGEVLTAQQVRDFAMQHSVKFEDNELKWAKTVEEIEHVYKIGPTGSCFAKTKKANLYASGDFAIAYLEPTPGKVTARTLCAPERKRYVYPYGDYGRLTELLNALGFKKSTNSSDYAGLKLLKAHLWDGYYADWYPTEFIDDPDNNEFLIVQ